MISAEAPLGQIKESIESAQVQEEEKNICVFQVQLDVKRREVDARARQIANCCATFEERCRPSISSLNDCMIVVNLLV